MTDAQTITDADLRPKPHPWMTCIFAKLERAESLYCHTKRAGAFGEQNMRRMCMGCERHKRYERSQGNG